MTPTVPRTASKESSMKNERLECFILFHRMFPVAMGVDAGGIGQGLQAGERAVDSTRPMLQDLHIRQNISIFISINPDAV